jgi:hypothetical protein
MGRIFKSLQWFLLVPYFAVGSIPARPWFGGSPEFSRRINAQLILTLILIWPLILLAPTEGRVGEAIKAQTYIFAGLVMVPTWWFVSRWLKGNRERQYAAGYRALPRWQRIAFGLTTPTLMIVTLMLGAWNATPKRASEPRLACDDAAAKVTLDACSIK